MSTSANPTELVPFTIEAAEPATEIFIIDGTFKLVDQGIGRLEAQLTPGLYKVKFKAGSTIREVHQIVRAGQDSIRLRGPDLFFATTAPLAHTSTTREDHRAHAARLSGELHQHLGQGSQLLIFARDLVKDRQTNPAQGLTLHDQSGQMLVDLAEKVDIDLIQRWVGAVPESPLRKYPNALVSVLLERYNPAVT
jgi:hypothetical protein